MERPASGGDCFDVDGEQYGSTQPVVHSAVLTGEEISFVETSIHILVESIPAKNKPFAQR